MRKIILILLVLQFFTFLYSITSDEKQINNSNLKKITPLISNYKNKTIGDPIIYRYKLPGMPFIPSISLSFKDPSKNEDILIVTQSVYRKGKDVIFYSKIIPFKTGKILLPSVNILNYYVEPVSVTVNSVIDTSVTVSLQADYFPYQDYLDLIVFFIIVMTILLVYFIFRYLRKVNLNKKQCLTPKQKHQIWREACTYFSVSDIPKDIKDYYIKGSKILKNFIKIELSLDILDLTNKEIKDFLENKDLEGKDLLFNFFLGTDFIKFAKYIPTMDEFNQLQKDVLSFLKLYEPLKESDEEEKSSY